MLARSASTSGRVLRGRHKSINFVAPARRKRFLSSEASNSYEATQLELLKSLEKPEGVMVDGPWHGCPMPPLWDRCILPPEEVTFVDVERSIRSLIAQHVLSDSIKPPIPHFKELISDFDYRRKFEIPFQSVIESLNAQDYDHLETIFGPCLQRKFRGWRSKWESEGLQLKLDSEVSVLGFATMVSLTQASVPETVGTNVALSLDGQDLDYEVRNAPGFFKLFTSMPSFLNKYQSARFFKYAPCFGVAAMGDAAQYSLAIWIKIITTESLDVIHKPSKQILYSELPTQRSHIWKFGTTFTADHMEPFKIYDMDGIVEDSVQKLLLTQAKERDRPYIDHELKFDSLLDPQSIDPSWWIESRRFASYPKSGAFFARDGDSKG